MAKTHLKLHNFAAVLFLAAANSAYASPAGLTLAKELAQAGDHTQAAVEFRRLALGTEKAADRGAFYWMAGYEYWKAGRTEQAERMVGLAEDAAPDRESEVYWLRAENSLKRNRPGEAGFYLESLAGGDRPEKGRNLAARKLAAVRLQNRDFEGARKALSTLPEGGDRGLAAVGLYEKGRDKSPMVGGLLGLVPGMGYAYSGEYANATRSLLLNALCVWGIVSFAEDEAWGGVAVVGFAEITFYTGSIYGGVDAAARHNRNRFEKTAGAIGARGAWEPDLSMLPVLKLNFEF
ncbi:MAG: hypothetical protein R6X19_06785 [Kiritimatiellia bacterium]